MPRVDYRTSALMLLALPLAGMAQNEPVKPVEDEQRVLAESFAQLVFGFCSAVVSQAGTPKLDQVPSSVMIRGPFPLSETGNLSGPLQDRFEAEPESMIYQATTRAAGVDRFHIAYARADGSACIVLAQDMPDAVSRVSTQIASDSQYKLQAEDKKRRVYVGTAAGSEQSIIITVPATLTVSAMEEVHVRRLTGNPVKPASGADIQAWSSAVFQACLESAQQRTAVSVASFGEFMTERPTKDGKMSIVSPSQYPSSMLFIESGPQTGCRIMLSAGVEENAQVAALWREELLKLSAKRRSVKNGGEEFVVARARDGETAAGARCTIMEVISGLLSVTILSD
jgi:hypothetical protein